MESEIRNSLGAQRRGAPRAEEDMKGVDGAIGAEGRPAGGGARNAEENLERSGPSVVVMVEAEEGERRP